MEHTIVMKKQNRCLNCEKGLACILVIVLHCEFPTYIGSVINIIARMGVPLFFMVSGFFLYSENHRRVLEQLPGKVYKMLRLVATYYLINFLYEIIVNCKILKIQEVSEFLAVIFIGGGGQTS